MTTETKLAAYPPRRNRRGSSDQNSEGAGYDPIFDEPEGRRGDGRNWIEKSSPIGIGKLVEGVKDAITGDGERETDGNYDLGVNGISFQIGDLSKRMYDTLMSVAMRRFPEGAEIPSELGDVYKLYAMDITAKEAVKAALDQNGLQLAIDDSEGNQSQDEGMWGDIDFVKLIDPMTGEIEEGTEDYDSFDAAVEEGDWEPGQPFNFVIRNVPARLKEMDISDLLSQLDPNGKLREEAKEKGITLPDEDVASLSDLEKESDRRVRVAPYEVQDANNVYIGDGSKGYNIIKRSGLLAESGNPDGTENDQTLMHVMDSLVSHSGLIVDVTDGGTRFGDAVKISKMWEVSSDFFNKVGNNDELIKTLTCESTEEGRGMVGFASFPERGMQTLEARILRDDKNQTLAPDDVAEIVGEDGVVSLMDSYNTLCDIGKDIVRVAVAAANMEYEAFLGESDLAEKSSDLPLISGLTFDDAEIAGMVDMEGGYVAASRMASEAAILMVDELIDDGKVSAKYAQEPAMSMTPQRICRYKNEGGSNDKNLDPNGKETFGAHTDTAFMTLIPVAKVSGLEIFDEGANKWFRPELLARQAWEKERRRQGLDTSSQTDTVTIFHGEEEKEIELPWQCRYVVAMPGQLLQVATRNEVAAAVHRVIAVPGGDNKIRISAPVLLRPQFGTRMNLSKYFGRSETAGSLLKECDGMRMEDIYDALSAMKQ